MPRQEGMVVIGLNSAAGISFLSDEISVKELLKMIIVTCLMPQFSRVYVAAVP